MIFWDHSSDITKVSLVHKKTIRLITGVQQRESYKDSFEKFCILHLTGEKNYLNNIYD